MFVDDRPVSTFQYVPGWKPPAQSHANGAIKRPPIGNAGSSSSTLSMRPEFSSERLLLPHEKFSSSSQGALQNNIPLFQAFLRQTPPLEHDHLKPLPPTPFQIQRTTPTDTAFELRRSSSVYSRTPSQWGPDSEASWKTEDFEGDLPSGSRPIAYSISTPDLKQERKSSYEFLEPRVFSPLIISPSPTASTITLPLPSPPRSRPATTLLPPPMQPLMAARQKVRTVSLKQAIQKKNAPGSVPLLPEELRAQQLAKQKPKEEIRPDSLDMFGGGPSAVSSNITLTSMTLDATLVDNQGRQRVFSAPVVTPPATDAQTNTYPLPSLSSAPYENAFHVGSGPVRSMAPPTPNSRRVSYRTSYPPHNDEDRGRRQERGRRSQDSHYNNHNESFSSYHQEKSRTLVDDYHNLLQEYHRHPSNSSAFDSDDPDDSVRAHMKMVPQPLFMGKKQLARKSGSLRKGSGTSTTLSRRQSRSYDSLDASDRSGVFPLRLSLTSPPQSEHRASGSSTMGIIPISPPSFTANGPRPSIPPPAEVFTRPSKRKQKEKAPARESQFYPHIMRRASSKQDDKPKKRHPLKSVDEGQPRTKADSSPQHGKPLLAVDIIAQKLKTPDTTPDSMSPLGMNPPGTSRHQKKISDGSAHTPAKRTVFQRVKGYTAMTSSRRRSSAADQRDLSPSSPASPESPHLFPSPVKAAPQIVHLGWSDTAKQTFDEVSSPTRERPSMDDDEPPPSPTTTTTSGVGRRPSLFSNINVFKIDRRWNNHHNRNSFNDEMKAQKRREDLKKMIKVVGPGEGVQGARRSVESEGPRTSGEAGTWGQRLSLSGYKWV